MAPRHPADPIRTTVSAYFGQHAPLGQLLPKYEVREGQIELACQVLSALQHGERLVAEAGTGTGKTLAYLIPAVLSRLKVVVSTGTRTLQEQIYEKDIPLLRQLMQREIKVACMKGISNYLCRRRFAEARRTRALALFDGEPSEFARIEAWASGTTTGDRAELSTLADGAATWADVSPTPETRLGQKCRHYEECFVTRMRRQAAEADIVVVNHHLLLADLSVRREFPDASVIPPYEALILDEAHGLEGIATQFFSCTISHERVTTLHRDVLRQAALVDDRQCAGRADRAREASLEVFYLLGQRFPRGHRGAQATLGDDSARFAVDEPPLCGATEPAYHALDAHLEALAAQLARGASDEVQNLSARCSRLRDDLSRFAEPARSGHIFWGEHRFRGVRLHVSPVDVAEVLGSTLLEAPIPIVFTSATLATTNRTRATDAAARGVTRAGSEQPLTYFCERIGLGTQSPPPHAAVIPSPFDFASQALLYVPRDLPLPSSPGFVESVAGRMVQLINMSRGRALVLFTSHRNLLAVHALIAPQLDYTLLCQGSAPRTVLLRRFREDVSSVLLATSSFWQGVDVVGDALSMVVIDKLPFAVPTDPITNARIADLRDQGRDPFASYQLPQALIALKQGFGRLIRHRKDRGVVAILDRRLHERPYGRYLLDGLPSCPLTTDLLRIHAFYREPQLPDA